MTDRLTPEQRSNLMRRVLGKNTTPELIVRRLAPEPVFAFAFTEKTCPASPIYVSPPAAKRSSSTDVSGTATAAKSDACQSPASSGTEPSSA
jgi:hypothetical protein